MKAGDRYSLVPEADNASEEMSLMEIQEETKRRPLYQRTAEALSEILESVEPGTYLPSEPKLARSLGVSRATLREAMRIFERRGRIVRRQGVGTYVTQMPHVIDTGIETLESIERLADRIGLAVETGDLEIRERTATEEEQRQFKWKDGLPVVEISRVILADGRPVAFLIDILPEEHLPADIIAGKFRGSILDVLLQREEPELRQCLTDITALPASPEVARHLKIQRGDALLFFEARLYSKEGEVIDHTHSYFLPGTFRFHINRRLP